MTSKVVESFDACGGQKNKVAKALSVSEVAARDSAAIVYNWYLD